jgi:hypothetical protein
LIDQKSNSHLGWRFGGLLVLAAIIIASLFLPPQLEQLRTGYWGAEHFLAYLLAVPIICLGWPRPFLVVTSLIPVAALLEVLQCLKPDHSPNVFAALSSIGGVLAGALLATVLIRAWHRQYALRFFSIGLSTLDMPDDRLSQRSFVLCDAQK